MGEWRRVGTVLMNPNEFMQTFRKGKPMATADQSKAHQVAKKLQKVQLKLSQMAAKISSGSLTEEELGEADNLIIDLEEKTEDLESLGTKEIGI